MKRIVTWSGLGSLVPWGVLVAILAAGGCELFGAEEDPIQVLRAEIDRVEDPERARAMRAQADVFVSCLAQQRANVDELSKAIDGMYRDRSVTEDEIQALMDHHQANRVEIRERLLASVLALRDLATEDEWERILAAEQRAYREQVPVTPPLVEEGDA